jgi:hypothetical protein
MNSDDIPVQVKGVFLVETLRGSVPLVLLEDDEGAVMPIYIGPAEAVSIHTAFINEVSPRPLTHDLFVALLDNIEYDIRKIVIDELKGSVYYAKMTFENKHRVFELDARPSDCIAIALRTGVPIFVSQQVFNESKVNIEQLGELKTMDDLL